MRQTPPPAWSREVEALPPQTEIVTERLTLRFPQSDEARAIWERVSDATFPRYLPWAQVESLAETEARLSDIQAAWDSGDSYCFGVHTRDSSELIGHATISRSDASGEAWSIAFMIDSNVRGRGFAAEAAHALLDLGFARLGAKRIWAGASPSNDASLRVIEKLGMRHFRSNPNAYKIGGLSIATEDFEIESSEWKNAR